MGRNARPDRRRPSDSDKQSQPKRAATKPRPAQRKQINRRKSRDALSSSDDDDDSANSVDSSGSDDEAADTPTVADQAAGSDAPTATPADDSHLFEIKLTFANQDKKPLGVLVATKQCTAEQFVSDVLSTLDTDQAEKLLKISACQNVSSEKEAYPWVITRNGKFVFAADKSDDADVQFWTTYKRKCLEDRARNPQFQKDTECIKWSTK
eukprot:TRINITY_DN10259_c0_g1_i1.p1 TRINITY_DN10259_c0_g1~~TRINITY_DN10259_c0_g1_i1.p1  ORF type:complete len:209 (-),score=39.68 TRINITY_DN10259_c0_g1_i1:34-660(-)